MCSHADFNKKNLRLTKKPIHILAIESSCDDTSAAVLINGSVVSNVTATQLDHAKYGGVVPELASRQHNIHIALVVKEALEKAGISEDQLDAVGVTQGPGLMGSLVVGVAFAKALALGLDIPLIGVHHMHAHILAHLIDEPRPDFPFLCLTVSGGHTQLVVVRSYNRLEILGTTIDDAAGEAFDKSGKMLGLPYPAGPHIDRLASQGKPVFQFSKAKLPDFDFSFSGFKTSVLYFLNKNLEANPNFIQENLADLCASIQKAIIDMLLDKLTAAVNYTGITRVAIAGGVSANKGLRTDLSELANNNQWDLYIPAFEYCTDNAAMIGMNAHFKFTDGDISEQQMTAMPRMPF